MLSSTLGLAKVILNARSARLLILAGILSVGFSFAVILTTQGIMNGYVSSLLKASHTGAGDIQLIPRKGISFIKGPLYKRVEEFGVYNKTPVRQMESFLIHKGVSQGILIKAVDRESFNKVTQLDLKMNEGVVIGEALASDKGIKVNDFINLAFAKGNSAISELPIIKRFKVNQIISHGIYEKDSRLVYVDRAFFNKVIGSGDSYNIIEANIFESKTLNLERINKEADALKKVAVEDFRVKTFIDQHEIILKAVEIQKLSISITLYLIVFIAIFNIAALIYFIREKRLKEFFLFWAVGLSLKYLKRFWYFLILIIWALGGVSSFFFCKLIGIILKNFLIVPGEVYVLNELGLLFNWLEVSFVLLLGLFWMLLLGWWCLRSLYSKELVKGLRQEF